MPWPKTGVYHTTDISSGDYWWMRWDGSTFSSVPDGSINVFFTGITGPYGPYSRFKGTNPLILLEKGWTLGVDQVQRFMTVDRDDYVDGKFTTNASANLAFAQFIRSASIGNGLYWVNGQLDVSVIGGGNYDASLAQLYNKDVTLDASIVELRNADLSFATNASIGLAGFAKTTDLAPYATNASVGLALAPYATNASVGLALAPYATNASIGLAGFAKQTSLNTTDASLNTLTNRHNITEASLGTLTTRVNNHDTSIAGQNTWNVQQDGSINALFTKNTQQDASLNDVTNITGMFVLETSIAGYLAPYATNASVGLALAPYATNASVNLYATKTDASIVRIDGSINALYTSKFNQQVAEDVHLAVGFVNRTDSSLSFNNTTRVLTIHSATAGFDIYSDGIKFHKTADVSIQISDVSTMHFVYFNGSGTLVESISAWNIESENSPAATVYWTGTAGALSDERHSAMRNVAWHAWAHDTIGARYESGLTGTFTSASTNITAGYIHDEDIDFYIPNQLNNVRIWYRTPDNKMTFDAAPVAITARVSGGNLQYDNAGVLTTVTNNGYICNHVYASTDVSMSIMTVVAQQEYSSGNAATNLANARNAPLPTFPNIGVQELKLIYRVIWRNDGGTPTYIESQDYRTSTSLPAGGTPTIVAAGVTYTPYGDIAATNVQAALNELSDEKATLTYVNSTFIPNVSIGTGLYWVNGQLDVSVEGGAPGGQDASIANLYDIKVNNYTYHPSAAGPDPLAYGIINNYDGSIKLETYFETSGPPTTQRAGLQISQDAGGSGQVLTLYNESADLLTIGRSGISISGYPNTSETGDLITTALEPYATNASIGDAGFAKTVDVSTDFLRINDASTTYAKRLTSFTSCVSTYTVNASDNNNVIDASGTYTITFPNTLETGFATTVFNIGSGVLTLNASTIIAYDSSVALRNKGCAATVIHRGSGIFYAAGQLT